ncbi:hypothetical protein [Mesorhizobium mediterraneum]|uniref:hypothetical protein n=1 Tax=Mesorhizobium mediterraneum TaxID=43617 RepID=UPI001FEEC117|nr:hypothetical protein [Mesorhizobium mediterraneum]
MKLVQALTRGLEDVAHVDPWTTSFNPGTTPLTRLLELTREVDFAAFVFARVDDGQPARFPSRWFRPGFSARQCRLRSRPFSAASSACAEPSYCMRAVRSFRPISSD